MSLFDNTLSYFRELSQIPRKSHQEEKVREWLISWAKSHNWKYEEDSIGNILIVAPTQNSKLKTQNLAPLCLQGHMDMVCVSKEAHDWESEGVTVIEENGVLKGTGTTLGADNGIGVAAMMTIAELEKRPTLELLFTMGEEVGLIGAHNIDLPLTAPLAINLDWCDSETIGIGCGGTLLMEGAHSIQSAKYTVQNTKIYTIKIAGMRGGHSGIEIGENRGNALIELATLINEQDNIVGVTELSGGDADNAIPRSSHAIVLFDGKEEELSNWLQNKTLEIREKTGNNKIEITLGKTEYLGDFYQKNILSVFVEIGSGVQIVGKEDEVLSSWNLGKMKLKNGILTWCYFLRTNIPEGIEPMKQKIFDAFKEMKEINWSLSHESPVWLADGDCPFVKKIQENMESVNNKKIPVLTTHAAIEVSTLAEKYPNTTWISIGATCHDMHTTREHISLADLEEFCERLERIIQDI